MPLQNRVTPYGEIVAVAAYGEMMGNRGGRVHDPLTRQLHPTKRWASRQWICCKTRFNDRQRIVMGKSYTELFFLDEITAMAAGHRPCFECRRQNFMAYAKAVQNSKKLGERMTAKQMDDVLHNERLDGQSKRITSVLWDDLPDGAAVCDSHGAVMKYQGFALRWSDQGYEKTSDQPYIGTNVECLTPDLSLSALHEGYQPQWHSSVEHL